MRTGLYEHLVAFVVPCVDRICAHYILSVCTEQDPVLPQGRCTPHQQNHEKHRTQLLEFPQATDPDGRSPLYLGSTLRETGIFDSEIKVPPLYE